jgi:hypothetical protein
MDGVLLGEGAGKLDDVSGQAPLAGLQHPAFGVVKTGEIEEGELLEGALGVGKALLELTRGGAQRGDRARSGLGNAAAGIAHQGLAGSGVGVSAPGGEESFGLPGAKAVAEDRLGQALLLAVGKAGQGRGGRAREASLIEVSGQLGGQPSAEGQTSVHPASSTSQ